MVAYYCDGRRLRLGGLLGRGGEGEVFSLEGEGGRAVKLYLAPDGEREAKVAAMVAGALARACPSVAFPEGMVVGGDGRFAGFTMPQVLGCRPVHELYSTRSRRGSFPDADFRFLVRTARNVARAVASVHDSGAILGDINQSGILVDRRARVRLIDADSFQIAGHPCRVGVLDFTPPELQGSNLARVARTTQHDAFGLAVMIFRLLFLGRHPMAGVPAGRDVALHDAIRQQRFAYSLVRDTRMAPPPGTCRLADLPHGVRANFETAFGNGFGPRPEARDWAEVMSELEAGLRRCCDDDRHYFNDALAACPWCAIERVLPSRLFGAPGAAQVAFDLRQPTLIEISAGQALDLAGVALGCDPKQDPVGRNPVASLPARAFLNRRSAAQLAALRKRLRDAKGAESTNPFMEAHVGAGRRLEAALARWRLEARLPELRVLSRRLRAKVDELRQIPVGDGASAELLRREERDRLVEARLRSTPLDRARVHGVSASRSAAVVAAGVVTAYDVTPRGLRELPDLGPVPRAALLVWRDRLIARFERDLRSSHAPGSPALAPGDQLVLAERARRLAGEVALATRRVEQLAMSVLGRSREPSGNVDAARSALAQALADLRHIGLPVRGGPSGACGGAAATAGGPAGGSGRKRMGCPRCGGPLVKRWGQSGGRAPAYFLGCVAYPACSGSRPLSARRKP